MRQGYNPQKDKAEVLSEYYHQVIIPVFLPNRDGYFKDGLQILHYCLRSLLLTIHPKTFITIVNNGSSAEVAAYLEDLRLKGEIHELVHTTNIGKINAVIKGLGGHSFELVTVADADVMFLSGWQDACYEVFRDFPKAGAVCTTPSSKSLRTHTANIWAHLLFSDRLAFRDVQDAGALNAFAHSIGNPDFYSKLHLERYLTVTSNQNEAVVGAGHFVATYRGDVFQNLSSRFSRYKLGGDSLDKILDKPVLQNGFWRLSTVRNYTFHMGNVAEDWMSIALQQIKPSGQSLAMPLLHPKKSPGVFRKVLDRLFANILNRKKTAVWLLRVKGMSASDAKNYLS
ncbi:glycosyltransferase family A protein [Flavobacterium selenitireducens]|uniref:glycosyltransferase family A protein n=1 Tax=Flavobacterium selenitireducens TaxID=2722704 RepID=UPI00168BDA86|nr:glycosyltransferase family A protein [Flavobacterium selenitireducens]MBD3583438.1 glycosyltransferase family 2 protein [Flavobacterium selenitireducens]